MICPSAIPPSLGGTRWCQYGRKPADDKLPTAISVSYLFWKQPPVSTTRDSPTRSAVATIIRARVW